MSHKHQHLDGIQVRRGEGHLEVGQTGVGQGRVTREGEGIGPQGAIDAPLEGESGDIESAGHVGLGEMEGEDPCIHVQVEAQYL